MVTIDQLALAALNYESLQLRSLTQDLLRANAKLNATPRPTTNDPRLLAIAASLIELLALRQHQSPPAWAKDIAPLNEPIFLVKAAETMKHLRTLCETQSPEPMRKRGLYAPPNFLEFA
jgi:predicted secreted protein